MFFSVFRAAGSSSRPYTENALVLHINPMDSTNIGYPSNAASPSRSEPTRGLCGVCRRAKCIAGRQPPLLSQPAVSRALQRLRDMFHDNLFVRTATGYDLTPQGHRLLQELELMLPKLDRLLSGTSFDPAVEEANFCLAVTDNAAAVLVPILCRKVLPAAKKVHFDFIAWHRGSFDDVAHGRVDLAFASNAVEAPPPLQGQTIYEEQFVCVADGKRRLPRSLTLEQYLELEHISISILGGIQVSPDKALAAMGHKRKIAIHVPYFEAAIRAVQGDDVAPRLNTDAAHGWLRETMRQVGAWVART
ncbi:LysR family transcriptional regulator [Occallatibacter riparius]|uniref:LysR substrate-binding domain-containing protein n=1 Tax=Occallatibacter riparius TaxID=1002689 RepID=A0A9J7BZ51_9BACT|nr:LysR family transcriptional regulator [Occallatibacter riparius]UWZ86846.1 LysR substrate-binding domain-containing protein [Occallatibacter riparius]